MTYKIKIIRLDGTVFESEINYAFDPSKMSAYYLGPNTLIQTKIIATKCSPFSGDIEEVVYKEVKDV